MLNILFIFRIKIRIRTGKSSSKKQRDESGDDSKAKKPVPPLGLTTDDSGRRRSGRLSVGDLPALDTPVRAPEPVPGKVKRPGRFSPPVYRLGSRPGSPKPAETNPDAAVDKEKPPESSRKYKHRLSAWKPWRSLEENEKYQFCRRQIWFIRRALVHRVS